MNSRQFFLGIDAASHSEPRPDETQFYKELYERYMALDLAVRPLY